MQKIRRKGVELLRGLHQPLEDRVRIDLAPPCRAADTQAFGEAGQDPHDKLRGESLALEDRPACFIEVAVAGDALQLAPGLATGMPIGADIAAAQPAMIGTIRLWAEVRVGVDSPSATSGVTDDWRWEARRLGRRIGCLFTGGAQRFVDESGEGFGLFDASTSALMGLGGRCGHTRQVVRPHNVHEEADQPESDQQELVKQRGGYHWELPSHRSEIGVFYLIDSCWNYPLSRGTRPAVRCHDTGHLRHRRP